MLDLKIKLLTLTMTFYYQNSFGNKLLSQKSHQNLRLSSETTCLKKSYVYAYRNHMFEVLTHDGKFVAVILNTIFAFLLFKPRKSYVGHQITSVGAYV